jgi:putative spermidine/putrescine transport system permease protein
MRPDFTFESYVAFLTDPFYLGKLWLTFWMGAVVTLVTLLLAYPAAYVLARRRIPLKGLLIGLFLSPLLTNFIVLVFAWLLFLSNNGVVNSVLKATGLLQKPLGMLYDESGVIIALIHVSLPYAIFPLIGAIANVDRSAEEAAVGLGASPLGAVLRVVLPLSMPGILAAGFITFSIVLSSFAFALFIGGDAVLTIPMLVWQNVDTTRNWPMAAAISFIAFVATMLLLLVLMMVARLARTRPERTA